jgi:hypothetical protein
VFLLGPLSDVDSDPVGSWLNRLDMPRRTGCSGCWVRRCGTRTRFVTNLRRYVADELGDPRGLLVPDDTGDVKKGNHSVGSQSPRLHLKVAGQDLVVVTDSQAS